MNGLERIRLLPLQDKVVSVEKALQLIQDGDVIGLSGFGGAGEAKTVPLALAEYAQASNPYYLGDRCQSGQPD